MAPIYLDNAASTRVADQVVALMTEVMRTAWGNPSAAHPQGAAARAFIATARGRLLAALGDTGEGDIVWTSGCTEADALALVGAARGRTGQVVTTTIEHPAVTATARHQLGDERVIEIPAGRDGVIDPDTFAAACDGAAVASIVMVQNEIGVVQPVAAIADAIRARAPHCHIHVDAAQALGKIAIAVRSLNVDSIAFAAHKLHGPKGVGALWLKTGTTIDPLWVGGGQQGGRRGGTQDAPGTAGFGLAAERAVAALPEARARWLEFAALVHDTLGSLRAVQLVPDQRRAPHILALALPGVPASALRTVLSSRGVYLSTGSACNSGDTKASAVLAAIGVPEDHGVARLSFGLDTTRDQVATAATLLGEVARSLRATGGERG